MKNYIPRRQSRRWLDAGCPQWVLAIYDNRGQTADRYTVFYRHVHRFGREVYLFGRDMSEDPCHPCGVGLSIQMLVHEVAAYRYRFRHRACRWSDLPEAVQRLILEDCKPGGLGSPDPAPDDAEVVAA